MRGTVLFVVIAANCSLIDSACFGIERFVALHPNYASSTTSGEGWRVIAEQSDEFVVADAEGTVFPVSKERVVDIDEALDLYSQIIREPTLFDQSYNDFGEKGLREVGRMSGDQIERAKQANAKDKADKLVARARLWALKKEYEIAEKDFQQALSLSAAYPYAYFGRGEMWLTRGDYDKAIDDFTNCIRAFPKWDSAFLMRSRAWGAKGNKERSINDFSEAIRIKPEIREGFIELDGFVLDDAALREQRLDALSALIEIDRKDMDSLRARGLLFQSAGRFDSALNDFNELLRQDPRNSSALLGKASVLVQTEDFAGAVEALQRATEVLPNDPHPRNDLAWLRATCSDPKFRDGKLAVELAKEACRLSAWKNGDYIDTLAAAHAESGQFDTAAAMQQMAIDLADDQDKPELISRLDLYRSQKPYHLPAKGQ